MQAQGIIIEEASQKDLPELFEISSIVHSINYTELIPDNRKKDFFDYYEPIDRNRNRYIAFGRRKMDIPHFVILKAVSKMGDIVGFISGEKIEPTTFEIRSLFVDPLYQSRGVGTMLMNKIIERYGKNDMCLKVIEGNRAAISLYRKYEFKLSEKNIDKSFFGARLLLMFRDAVR